MIHSKGLRDINFLLHLILGVFFFCTQISAGPPSTSKKKSTINPDQDATSVIELLKDTENLPKALDTILAQAKIKCKSPAVASAARQQIIAQGLSGELSSEKFAEILMYAPFFDAQDQAWALDYLAEKDAAFYKEVLEHLSGYQVALHLYGSIVAGPDAIAAAGKNLILKTELITKFLNHNLEALQEIGQANSDLYKTSLEFKKEVEALTLSYKESKNRISARDLYERYQKLQNFWKKYQLLDAGQAQVRLDQIDGLETTRQALDFVKQASQLTLTVGVGILSGGLASGAVSSAFGAVDQIAEDAILRGEVDWSSVGRRVVIDAATGVVSGGSAGVVGKLGTKSAQGLIATGASEGIGNAIGRGVAVVAGHEVDSAVSAVGAGAEVAWQESAEGRNFDSEKVISAAQSAFSEQHSLKAIAVGAGAAGLRSRLVRLPKNRQNVEAVKEYFSTPLIAGHTQWMPIDPKQGLPALETLLQKKRKDAKYIEILTQQSLDQGKQEQLTEQGRIKSQAWAGQTQDSGNLPQVETQKVVPQGGGQVQSVFSVTLSNGTQTYFRPFDSNKKVQNSSVRNTYLAAQLNESMGLDTVPRTKLVQLTLPNGKPTMGVLSENAPGSMGGFNPPEKFQNSKSFADTRAFEFLIGNTDVHGSNFNVDLSSSSAKVQVFDHGPAFAVGIPIWSAGHSIGGVLPEKYTPEFIRSATALSANGLKMKFGDALTQEEIDSILIRRDLMLCDYERRGKPTLP